MSSSVMAGRVTSGQIPEQTFRGHHSRCWELSEQEKQISVLKEPVDEWRRQ